MTLRNLFKARPTFNFSASSHIGQVRKENQDAYAHIEAAANGDDCHLFVVADGMGGHTEGGEASRLAVETVERVFLDQHRALGPENLLQRAFAEANRRIYEYSQRSAASSVMGTTCTVLALMDGRLSVSHVGDSRLYRIDPGSIAQVTTDHTFAEMLRRMGLLTEEEARTHPRRHTLTRAMGIAPDIEVEHRDLGPMPESRACFLLCTDGLLVVDEETIFETVCRLNPQQACERLVEMANERGCPDNVTVVLVHFNE